MDTVGTKNPRCENQGLTVGHSQFFELGETELILSKEFKEKCMKLEKNDIRVQQTQQEEKPKKTKILIWKLFKMVVKICSLIYRVWKFLEGDLDS
jgi:hypothetical protein